MDCTDIDVAGLPACAPSAYELPCGDGLDNDKYIDLRDPECFALSFGGPPGGTGEANANDGVDNDADGRIDCADPDTWALMACSLDPRESGGQCTDGVDNDNDGYIDAVDPNCRP